jgi:prophage DNA circulation protein
MSESTVNGSLTLNPSRRVVENPEFAAFARRIIRAYSRRTADGDIEALTDLTALAAEVDTAIHNAVTGLRAYGYSWADIARPLGISRQAAQQRWGGDTP